MENTDDLLVATCRTMIKTVLSCLDNAKRGTIYKIGSMPELAGVPTVSDAVKKPMVSLSSPPPVPRGIRQGSKGRP